jgi:hypothetical protein
MTTDTETPPCAGKGFEHHETTEFPGRYRYEWRCPACGDAGTIKNAMEPLILLVPNLRRLQMQQLDKGAVFLLPSDATPGILGQFFGCDVYRAPGLPGPMIAIPALPFPVSDITP